RSRARIRTRLRCLFAIIDAPDVVKGCPLDSVGPAPRLKLGQGIRWPRQPQGWSRAASEPVSWIPYSSFLGVDCQTMAIQSPGAASDPELLRTRMRGLPKRFRQESANGLVAEWELRLGSQRFAISIADHSCTVREGPATAPRSVISTDPATWLAMDQGSLTGGQ